MSEGATLDGASWTEQAGCVNTPPIISPTVAFRVGTVIRLSSADKYWCSRRRQLRQAFYRRVSKMFYFDRMCRASMFPRYLTRRLERSLLRSYHDESFGFRKPRDVVLPDCEPQSMLAQFLLHSFNMNFFELSVQFFCK